MEHFELTTAPARIKRPRLHKDPVPRFKPDCSQQLDVVVGSPALALPADHLARKLAEVLGELDYAKVEANYSSQGRRGFHPRHVLGALIYGSLLGIHHSTKLSQRMRTDAALRFIAGGHAISSGVLRRFRRENRQLFTDAILRTNSIAHERGLLDPKDLAVDSVKLRAHASLGAARTRSRSEKRLAELGTVDLAKLSSEQLASHQEKVRKHREALELCASQERTNLVLTSPSAGLLKFPSGASAPGHRVAVVAAGQSLRLVVSVLIDAAGNDMGSLARSVLDARKSLQQAGVPLDAKMQVAADAGFFSQEDLEFIVANQGWLDALVNEPVAHKDPGAPEGQYFSQEAFKRVGEKMVCPAGKSMQGPWSGGQAGVERWRGVGCDSCGLRPQCTTNERGRSIFFNPRYVALRDQMRRRMEMPDASKRYNRRIATVEPVFSYIEDVMGFRRVSSRKAEAIEAEILLKVLAYNLSRLISAKRLRRLRFWVVLDA
ncbi:MAG TPA: transposase [Myxococcales bacterium]|nr:transposase [Myxococcales bacterium]